MGILVKHVRKTKTGRVDYRRTFPPALRPFVGGQVNFLRSLGSQESSGFLSRYEAAASEYAALEGIARKKRDGAYDALDAPTIAYLAEAYHGRWSRKAEDNRWNTLNWGGASGKTQWSSQTRQQWSHHQRGALLHTRTTYVGLRAAGDPSALLEAWADRAVAFAAECGCLVDREDQAALVILCRALNDAAIRGIDDELARNAGKHVPLPAEPSPPAHASPQPIETSAVPIMATYDAYAVHMTPGVRTDLRANIQRLVNFVGHDDARRLTTDDIMRWRDALGQEVGRSGKLRDPVTIKGKYVGAVKAMLNWAVQERLLDENVATPVTVRVPKKVRTRSPGFTNAEALAILSATLEPASVRLSPGYVLARRWIPWLCAYTGARVNEFSQLRGEDVQQIDGIWVVRITPEAGTVKSKEARLVPLHSHLLEQGFVRVAKANGSGPLFFDPERQRVASGGSRHFKKVGERLAEWVREEVGVTDPAIKPSHAWRHLFKTRAFAVDIQERVADAIQGHAAATVSRGYGELDLQTLADAIERLPRFKVPGV